MNQKNLEAKSLAIHAKYKGKIGTKILPTNPEKHLDLLYTPGVSFPCLEIVKNRSNLYKYTIKSHTVAIITNGTAVLGLGDIGADASLPVMEGKALLLKKYVNVDMFPICINEKDPKKFVEIVTKIITPFGAINLEDIASPDCVYIENELQRKLDIPVFHDDQHGTAIAILGALFNVLKIKKVKSQDLSILVCGVGAAGSATIKLLNKAGFNNITGLDEHGTIHSKRPNLNIVYKDLLNNNLIKSVDQNLAQAIKNKDIFIGLSKGGILNCNLIKSMNKEPIIFCLANPTPEASFEEAKKANVFIYASGKHSNKNQINNFLVFPAIFKGALESNTRKITDDIKIKMAIALANEVSKRELIERIVVPKVSKKNLHKNLAKVFYT